MPNGKDMIVVNSWIDKKDLIKSVSTFLHTEVLGEILKWS